MLIDNDKAKQDAVLDASNVSFSQATFFPVTIQSYARDLLEARELIKEMREALSIHATRDINCQCEFCEKQRDILEKTKDYA